MLQQQQSSANESFAPPGGDGAGDQGSSASPNPSGAGQRGRIIAISAGVSGISTLLLVILIGGVIFAVLQNRRQGPTYQYQKVTQDNFALTVSMTGPLQGGTYNVVFSGTGKIAEIDVKMGQTVKKNQVLAKLDKTSLQDAVDQAQAAALTAQTTLANAEANLNRTQAQSQASVQAALTALANVQVSLSTTQAQSQASVAAAQTSLNNDQTNLSQTQTQSQASINAAQTALNNDQINLSRTQAAAQAQINLARAQEQQAISNCNSMPTPTPNCVQVAQDQYNQAVSQANASVAAAQARVNSDQKQLALTQAQANANNAAAQAKVNSDQQQLALADAQANSNNTTAQNQVSTAMSQLNTAQANANASNTNQQGLVNTAQSQLQAALVQLQAAMHNLDNATLTAPHAGIVTVVNGTVGGTPGVPVNSPPSAVPPSSTFIQIEDASVLQIQANVNESDTANVRVGNPTQFTVSAYGNQVFRGTVSAVSPNGVTVSNVVTFPVTVDVDMNSLQGKVLLPGMTANVTIDVVQRSNVLLIPVTAVNFARAAASTSTTIPRLVSQQQATSALNKASQMLQQLQFEKPDISMDNPVPAFILEQSNGQFVVKPVVLGITDGTNYEVLAGLSPGETIVVGLQRGG